MYTFLLGITALLGQNSAVVTQETPKAVPLQQVVAFENFTGKIIKNRVRMRCHPSLDGHIVQEFKKNDFVLITGQEGDYWIIAPPPVMKFFVFRSYIIDNMVEANRVNIRLSPDTESPIVGQLMHGDHVEGEISSTDHKWLEISPPSSVHFFVAKEFVEKTGDQEYFSKIQTRKEEADALLNSAYFLTQSECKKPFNEMTTEEATQKFEAIIQGYTDFPDHVQQAKEGLSLLQDNYLQKKAASTETKDTSNISLEKEKSSLLSQGKDSPANEGKDAKKALSKDIPLTKKMSSWTSIEEDLFSAWQQLNSNKDIEQFYYEQDIDGISLSGVIEPYDVTLKDRPGDFLLKKDSIPIAFLYSTRIDLTPFIGKKVTIKAVSRSNHNFAFPAYFVTSIQK